MKPISLGMLTVLLCSLAHADDFSVIKSVGEGSRGSAEARAASSRIVSGGAKNLIPTLQAFEGSSMLASNWLRSTFETIADSEIKAGRSLPKGDLLAFVKDASGSPAARRLAYEWILKRSPQVEDELIPQLLLDPSPEFRRDAVARLLSEAKKAGGDEATNLYRRALTGAVHEDQVKTISKALRDAGDEVNLQRHFGFLASWKIIGPFDNKDKKGFPIPYPPETKIDLSAEYDGQLGKVKWEPISTDEDFGLVNIAEQIENYKGSLMYATTNFQSRTEQTIEIRLGTPNAWKLWVNDELIFEREEYHRSTKMDQYKIPVALKKGDNRLLIKVCQNEQEDSWAQKYQFQLRICDSTGAAVLPAADTALNNSSQGAAQ